MCSVLGHCLCVCVCSALGHCQCVCVCVSVKYINSNESLLATAMTFSDSVMISCKLIIGSCVFSTHIILVIAKYTVIASHS